MAADSDITQAVGVEEGTPSRPFLELQIYTAGGSDYREPFHHDQLVLGQPDSPLTEVGQWQFQLDGEGVAVERLSGDCTFSHGGAELTGARLGAGDQIELGGHRIWIVDTRQPPLASLEDYSSGRSWPLHGQQYCLGRKGSRQNHLELNFPTISRSQASLLPDRRGQFQLLVETDSSPSLVNGRRYAQGSCLGLRHGDLLQFGDRLFRFRLAGATTSSGKIFNLRTLGAFEVRWGSEVLAEARWKVEKARWLVARIGLDWSEPTAIEPLVEEFWPDLGAVRGRKNLSQCVASVRAVLGLEGGEDIFARGSATLQLDPHFLGDHDYVQVASLLSQRGTPFNPVPVAKALELYGGPFLPGCYGDWAIAARERLEREVREGALALAAHYGSKQRWEESLRAAQKALELDDCCQDAYEAAMNALLELNRPEEVLRMAEHCRLRLKASLDLEPSTDLLRLHQLARMRL